MSDDIPIAKQRLPLPALMHQLGLGDHAKKSAKCPFHDDKHNSYSIWASEGDWLWKCHAGCGTGDEVTFLEKHKGISRGDAIKLFLEMAGVNGPLPFVKKPRSTWTLDWRTCVESFTKEHNERLAKWRGYSIEFCYWLKENSLVGLYDGCIAFPVHDRVGNVVAVHYRLRDGSWRYFPQGAKVHPLVIDELVAGDPVHVFESQWDAFAFMDVRGERSGIIITRAPPPRNCVCFGWLMTTKTIVNAGGHPHTALHEVMAAAGASRPEFFRLPSVGGDPYFGLGRSYYYEGEKQGYWRLIRIRQRGKLRGVTLVPYDAIAAFIRNQARAEA